MWIVSAATFQQLKKKCTLGDETFCAYRKKSGPFLTSTQTTHTHLLFKSCCACELILTDLFVGAVSFDNHYPAQYAPLQNPCYLGRLALEDECGGTLAASGHNKLSKVQCLTSNITVQL